MAHWRGEDDGASEPSEDQPINVREILIRLPPRPCRLNRQSHNRELCKGNDEEEIDPSNVYRMHYSDCIPTRHRPSDVVDCEPLTASSSELLNEVINQTVLHAALQSEVVLNAQATELSLGPRLRLLLEDELAQIRRKEENNSNGIYYVRFFFPLFAHYFALSTVDVDEV
ncbi:hypothetical protein WR25_20579 [Diploscapter pachys]|uniref:Uncharacterized protein n=1 Tax=Diploscapter pachys TaxID=2018661 RepID=A0A2A2M2A1_9BILA|nr:hypothetical protein WR25_20579 [Diploscapter pachys]